MNGLISFWLLMDPRLLPPVAGFPPAAAAPVPAKGLFAAFGAAADGAPPPVPAKGLFAAGEDEDAKGEAGDAEGEVEGADPSSSPAEVLGWKDCALSPSSSTPLSSFESLLSSERTFSVL